MRLPQSVLHPGAPILRLATHSMARGVSLRLPPKIQIPGRGGRWCEESDLFLFRRFMGTALLLGHKSGAGPVVSRHRQRLLEVFGQGNG